MLEPRKESTGSYVLSISLLSSQKNVYRPYSSENTLCVKEGASRGNHKKKERSVQETQHEIRNTILSKGLNVKICQKGIDQEKKEKARRKGLLG